jgi:hypothetical protein
MTVVGLPRSGAVEAVVLLAGLDDEESQEYAGMTHVLIKRFDERASETLFN